MNVPRYLRTVAVVAVLALVAGSSLHAQGQADADAKAKADALKEAQQAAAEARKRGEERSRLVPLGVEIVVSRYQGEKKISSLPYSLAVNANDVAPPGSGVCQLRMGAQVPVPTTVVSKDNVSTPSFTYRDIGTNIDCSARTVDDGIYQLRLNIEDTSVYTNVQDKATPTVGEMPVFRTFRSTNTLVLRDGQTRDFAAAADRVNGEVIRIAVTLRVVK
jgi:type II secretory pathway pseudopilin PulG